MNVRISSPVADYVAILKEIFTLLEENVLVRNTDYDDDPVEFLKQGVWLGRTLAAAQGLVDNTYIGPVQDAGGWRCVGESQPPGGKELLFNSESLGVVSGWYDDGKFNVDINYLTDVTHWRYMPDPPIKE